LIQSVLVKYFDAFSSLDAYAAKEVWPGVNDAALSRAFDSLDEQHFDTDDCQVTVNGDSANAVCGGTIKYVQKVGPKTMRVEKRQWKFDLRHTDGEWLIQNVQTR